MTKSIAIMLSICLIAGIAQFAYAQNMGPKIGDETALYPLKKKLISYFEPVKGNIISAEEEIVEINIGTYKFARAGMRLHAFKEGAVFVHPITRKPLGRIEVPIGTVRITEARLDYSIGVITAGNPEDFVDAKVRISEREIRILFYQGNVDWFLGDSYHRMLEESGRFELIDTGIETDYISEIISEARERGADIALILQSERAIDQISLTQKIFWADDGQQISEKTVNVDIAYVEKLRAESWILGERARKALLSLPLPFEVSSIAVGDIDGDGVVNIILASGNNIKVYDLASEPALLWEFRIPLTDEVLWLDTIDANKNGRDEILITSIQDRRVVSFVYEFNPHLTAEVAERFVQLHEARNIFIRRLETEIIGQEHTRRDGFVGDLFYIVYAGEKYKRGENVKLSVGMNIYDFQLVSSPGEKQAILAWDRYGHLNLYDEKGIEIWESEHDFGGFLRRFEREAPAAIVGRGEWIVKDRLTLKGHEVLVPKRRPLLGIVRGLGYTESEIRSLWRDGYRIKERTLFGGISGEIVDYAVVGNRVIVLSRPLPLKGLLDDILHILRGKSPSLTVLYVFSAEGI
ncbi:MAG: VCBS repeat-containing protein [Thermodesulfovibrionales bacterium]|nr:VCBS repeat-containing protein [Thermodesulfovibrionales bacterium]